MKAKIVAATLGLGMVIGSLIGGTQAGAAPGGGAKPVASKNWACDCETKVVTSRLNLREGPGTNYDVLEVMPEGLKVAVFLDPSLHQNGFARVAYDEGDTYGWAYEAYLADPGSSDGGSGGGWGEDGADIVGVGSVETRVNFRTGPGTSYSVQYVLDSGSQLALTDLVVDGFRYVWHAGDDGWVCDLCITDDGGSGIDPGSTAHTTSNLNLRSQPYIGSNILLVIPDGGAVEVLAETQNGFRKVTYNGTTGWAYEAYLA
jgi:uncharacterized protein YraI